MARRARRKRNAKKKVQNTYREDEIKKSRPDSKPALIALLLVVILIGSGLYLTSMVDTDDENPINPGYGVNAELITNNHKTEPGGETDFVLWVENTGTVTDTFTVSIKSNDGGFTIDIEDGYKTIILSKESRKPLIINVKIPSSSEGLLHAYLEVVSGGDAKERADIRINVNAEEKFGNQTVIGDSLNVHYAGILASDARLFDTSMEELWDNYMHRKTGITNSNKHIQTLASEHIGCIGKDNPSDNCEGDNRMIDGFDSKTIGMYEGQTLAVRIAAKDAYGAQQNPDDPDGLAGYDLIFIINVASII